MIRITKRESILVQIFLLGILVLSLYKICLEEKIIRLDNVKIERRDNEKKYELMKRNTAIRENSILEPHINEPVNHDAEIIDILDHIFKGITGDDIKLQILNDGGYDSFQGKSNISLEGELTLQEFYEILRISEEQNEKIEINTFKLVFIGEDRIKCNVQMRIF